MMQCRMTACLAAAAGLVVSVGTASAQTAFSWLDPVPGLWNDTARWTPAGSPGAMSPLDTASLGLAGEYIVTANVSRTLGGLTIANPEATLLINPNLTLTVNGSVTGDGTVQVSPGNSNQNSVLAIGNAGTADAAIRLVGFNLDDAQLSGPAAAGTFATLGANGVVSGRGTMNGQWEIEGLIRASGADTVLLAFTDQLLTGGGTVSETLGGRIQWNNHLATDITFIDEPSIDPGETLRVGHDVIFDSPMVVSFFNSNANANLVVEPGVTLDAVVDLRGFNTDDARLTGPAAPGNDAVLAPTSLVFGNGTISGYFQFGGEALAADGQTINLAHPEFVLTGGGVFHELDGDFVWNNHLVTGITLRGMPKVSPGETLRVGNAVVFDDAITISTGDSFANANLDLMNGVVFSTHIVLNGFLPEDAQLRGPTGMGESATLGPSSVVSGQGTIRGPLLLQGLVRPDVGGAFDLALADSVLTGGGVIEELGEINWQNHLVTNITLRGDLNIDPGETLRVGNAVVFDDAITISTGDSFANANLDLMNGVVFSTHIVLNGFLPEDAQLRGPTDAGHVATLGATSTVTGQGTLRGALVLDGLISADAMKTVDFQMPESLIAGSGVMEQLGEFNWNGHTVEGMTLRGALDVDQGETLFIGAGAVLQDPIVVGSGNSFTNGMLRIRNGVTLHGDIILNGFGVDDARVGGENTEGASAGIGENAVISGRGTIDGRTATIEGTIAPGNGALGLDTIDIRTAIPVVLGANAVFEVGFAGVANGQFDKLNNGSELTLGGTLRVEALGGFEPLSSNEIEIITNVSGGTYAGQFDTIEYTGNLEPGDVARVFYEPNRAVFAVTCNADVTLPAGVLNILDVVAFINNWNAMGPGSDFNEDGQINILDVVSFINLWNVGCPE